MEQPRLNGTLLMYADLPTVVSWAWPQERTATLQDVVVAVALWAAAWLALVALLRDARAALRFCTARGCCVVGGRFRRRARGGGGGPVAESTARPDATGFAQATRDSADVTMDIDNFDISPAAARRLEGIGESWRRRAMKPILTLGSALALTLHLSGCAYLLVLSIQGAGWQCVRVREDDGAAAAADDSEGAQLLYTIQWAMLLSAIAAWALVRQLRPPAPRASEQTRVPPAEEISNVSTADSAIASVGSVALLAFAYFFLKLCVPVFGRVGAVCAEASGELSGEMARLVAVAAWWCTLVLVELGCCACCLLLALT
jgi:hypothetical protein